MGLAITADAGTGPGAGATRPAYWFLGKSGKVFTGTIAFDSSYPTGGELATDITSRFNTCHGIIIETDGTRLYTWDSTNNKIVAYTALGTEVGNGVNLSAVTGVNFIAWGV